MTREELIEFAKYLDEGCDLLGEGYIESRTDEYLQKVANKNFVNGAKLNGIEGDVIEKTVQLIRLADELGFERDDIDGMDGRFYITFSTLNE